MFGKLGTEKQRVISPIQTEVASQCVRDLRCEVVGMSTDRQEMSNACGHLAAAGFYSEEIGRCPFVQLGEILDVTDKLYAEGK